MASCSYVFPPVVPPNFRPNSEAFLVLGAVFLSSFLMYKTLGVYIPGEYLNPIPIFELLSERGSLLLAHVRDLSDSLVKNHNIFVPSLILACGLAHSTRMAFISYQHQLNLPSVSEPLLQEIMRSFLLPDLIHEIALAIPTASPKVPSFQYNLLVQALLNTPVYSYFAYLYHSGFSNEEEAVEEKK